MRLTVYGVNVFPNTSNVCLKLDFEFIFVETLWKE